MASEYDNTDDQSTENSDRIDPAADSTPVAEPTEATSTEASAVEPATEDSAPPARAKKTAKVAKAPKTLKDGAQGAKSMKAPKGSKSTTATKASAAKKAPFAAAADASPTDGAESEATEDRAADLPPAKRPRRRAAQPAKEQMPDSKAAHLVDEEALRFDALEAPAEPIVGEIGAADEDARDTATTDGAEGPAEPGADTAAAYGPLFQAPAVSGRRSRRASAPPSAPATPADTADRADAEDVPAAAPDQEEPSEPSGEAGEPAEPAETPRRRRRRGGKGRRSRSSAAAAKAGDDTEGSEETTAEADKGREDLEAGTEGEPEDEDSSTSRRRTRRRRRSGSADAEADEPGVTTKVRDSRRDEVTALKGSTRLEAKKQRRREGREAGRRRTIITEAEFLARRESVERVMVVRHVGDRTQIGVLEDGVLVEHYISRETTVSMAGNIYLGRVQNVLPSMEAAFVDIGKGRNAVLYAGEVNWDAAGMEATQPKRIENALTSGESVLVQVTKDPMGQKGARLTSQISLPGRYLVYVPNSAMTGISRKLPDTERSRLKKILKEVVPDTAGVIVRTAAEGASEEELRADVERLRSTWADITAKAEAASGSGKKKNKTGGAPLLLHGEPDLTVRVIRDIFNEDFTSLVVAGDRAWQEVSEYVSTVAPDLAERVTKWTSEEDLFTHYRVDEQIAKAMDRKVWLPSGGSLVIDRTEAMTVVDVNTGKFIGSGGNLEETVTKNNLEAAEEIVRQLRLRDVGGIIVIDFIDMVLESNRDLVVRRLLECLGRDRTKHQVAEVTSLGLVQMTRKRVGSGLIEVFSETCEVCGGRGIIVHSDPVDKSGNGHDHGDEWGTGRNGRTQGRTRVLEPPQRPGGPTPAQIAAAAHAAALKSSSYASEVVSGDGDTPFGEPAQDLPTDVVQEQDLEEFSGAPSVADEHTTDEPAVDEVGSTEPEPKAVEEPVELEAAAEPPATIPHPEIESDGSEPASVDVAALNAAPLDAAPLEAAATLDVAPIRPTAVDATPVARARLEPTPGDPAEEPSGHRAVTGGVEAEGEEDVAYAPVVVPTPAPRRHRGRVVAPAGPPPTRPSSPDDAQEAPVDEHR
jgi:ribonuclease E